MLRNEKVTVTSLATKELVTNIGELFLKDIIFLPFRGFIHVLVIYFWFSASPPSLVLADDLASSGLRHPVLLHAGLGEAFFQVFDDVALKHTPRNVHTFVICGLETCKDLF